MLRVSNVASNLVNRVSSTFSAITTSKPIASSGSQSEFQSNLDALIARSPSDEFIFDVPKDSHLSPFWATDAVLSQFPPTKILVRFVVEFREQLCVTFYCCCFSRWCSILAWTIASCLPKD